MPNRAVLVHGYSERSLSSYSRFPAVLKQTAPELDEVVVPAFNSLDDGVTHADTAKNALVAALQSVSGSILSRQPIHNDIQRGSYSFHLNEPKFNSTGEHRDQHRGEERSGVVTYGPLQYRRDRATVEQIVFADQFTYVDLTMPRIPDATYVIYDTTTERPEVEPLWPPFTPKAVRATTEGRRSGTIGLFERGSRYVVATQFSADGFSTFVALTTACR